MIANILNPNLYMTGISAGFGYGAPNAHVPPPFVFRVYHHRTHKADLSPGFLTYTGLGEGAVVNGEGDGASVVVLGVKVPLGEDVDVRPIVFKCGPGVEDQIGAVAAGFTPAVKVIGNEPFDWVGGAGVVEIVLDYDPGISWLGD